MKPHKGMQTHAERILRMLLRENEWLSEHWAESDDAVTKSLEDARASVAEYLEREFLSALLIADSECSAIAHGRKVNVDDLHSVSRLCRDAYECR